MKKHLVFAFVVSLLAFGLVRADNPHVPRGPVIVADITLSGQTSQTAALFTPSTDGTFRISTYMEFFGTPGSTTAVNELLSYTDDLQFEQFNHSAGGAPVAPCQLGMVCSITTVIRDKSGAPITVDIEPSNLPAGASYTAYVIVEQL